LLEGGWGPGLFTTVMVFCMLYEEVGLSLRGGWTGFLEGVA
jgi:hypothetical protein